MASSKVLNRSRKAPAEDTAAFGAVAERFRRAGQLDRAVGLCREGLQKFPDHISARATLGWALLDLGKYDEARGELEQVLRRAPDNLAAIRGLAELHDRFEHTLNLPMDGPGQWPPPPESVEASGQDARAAGPSFDDAVATFAAAGDADEVASVQQAEAEMPPAELGVPIWTPVTPGPAAASSTAGSGMSSVREIDPGPSAAERSASIERDAVVRAIDEALDRHARAQAEHTPAVPAAAARTATTADLAVSEAEIQALIAEAESLDAAVVAQTSAETDPVGSLALEATDDTDPLAAIAEVTGVDSTWVAPAPVAFAPSYSSVTQPIAVEVDLSSTAAPPPEVVPAAVAAAPQPPAVEVVAAIVEEPVESEVVEANAFVLTAPEVSELALVESDEIEIEMDAVAFATDPDLAPLLPFTAASAEPVIENAPVAAAIVELAVDETAAVLAMPVAAEVAAPVVVEVSTPAIAEIAVPVLAEVISIESAGRRSPLPQLERLLARVQARRTQLMAESVA